MVPPRWGCEPLPSPNRDRPLLVLLEREDIAIWRAQKLGVREIARRLTEPIDHLRELRRNASTRTSPRIQGVDGAMACRAPGPAAEGGQVGHQRSLRDYVQERLSGVKEDPMAAWSAHLARSGTEKASPIGRIVAG